MSVFSGLYDLPDIAIVTLFIAILWLVNAVLLAGLCRVTVAPRNDLNADFVARAQATLLTICVVMLAFAWLQARDNDRRAEARAATEAAELTQLDRLLVRYGEPAKLAGVRADLHRYAQSVASTAHPAVTPGADADADPDQLLNGVVQSVAAVKPENPWQATMHAELIQTTDALATSHALRVDRDAQAFPAIYVVVVIGLMLAVSGLWTLVPLTAGRLIAFSGQLCAVSALMALVFIADRPAPGQTGASPPAFRSALAGPGPRID